MRNAAKTAFVMALLTLISKLFGFIREMVLAGFFGASYITDSYIMATAIPGIIFGGILSAVSVVFLPIYSKTFEQEGELKANEFTSGVLKILMIVAIVLSIIGILISDQIVAIFAHGFIGDTAELTSFYLKITFSYIIFYSSTEILEAFLRYKGIFIPQVAFGFVHNIILISVIAISALTNYYYLAVGYLLVYFVRFIIMAALARKNNFRYRATAKIDNTVKRIMVLALPVFIGSGMGQINAFVDKTLASGLKEGSVSALNYGNLLVNMIMGLTITILTTIIYPKLARASAVRDNERLSNIVSTGTALIITIAVPFTFGAMTYSNQIVQIVYERGAFDPTATSMTSSAFFYYSIGLLFASLGTLLAQVYYSKYNTKTPVIFGSVGVIINITFSLILIEPMAHSGLALATSISNICTTTMLFVGLKKIHPEILITNLKQKTIKIILSAIVGVGSSYLIYIFVIVPFNYMPIPSIVQLTLAVAIAGLLYLLLLYILKIEEFNLLKQLIQKK